MKKVSLVSAGVLSVVCLSAWGYDNPIENGATQVVTNDWNVSFPYLWVGANTQSNRMEIVSGGRVGNQIGIVGGTALSSDNSVFVSNGGVWSNGMELSVGDLGDGNKLWIENDGVVLAENVYIGNDSSASGNRIDVFDSGVLQAGTIMVGSQGSTNTLFVGRGGAVESVNASIGYWIGSEGNRAVVSGTDAFWTNSGAINVGEYGSDNLLVIHGRGRVDSAVVNVGAQNLASNNYLRVSTTASVLNTIDLNIGGGENWAEVHSRGTINLKNLTIADGGNFYLNDGGNLSVDNDFDVGMNGFNWLDGGHLELTGSLEGLPTTSLYGLDDTAIFDGEDKTLTLNGGSWSNDTMNFVAGWSGQGNTVILTNGGGMSSQSGFIGYDADAENNSVIVSRPEDWWRYDYPESMWRNSGALNVGYYGSGNSLIIENGGRVESGTGIIGYADGADSNSVLVGVDSVWQIDDALYLGGHKSGTNWVAGGTGNSLTVGYVGRVLVGNVKDHPWDFFADFVVGDSSGTPEMIVDNESMVSSETLFIGLSEGESGSVTVTGDSVWNATSRVCVGFAGDGNILSITNGGRMTSSRGAIGAYFGSDSNSVLVSGAGSVWENARSLVVGDKGSGNNLTVSDGGRVESESGTIGSFGTNNSVTVSGSGSIWANAGSLRVGYPESDNSLSVAAGGRVENEDGYIGYYSGADHNSVLVSGGSVWQNYDALYLGGHKSGTNWIDGGTGNSLTVAGGRVLVGDVDTNTFSLLRGIVVGDTSGDPEMIVGNGSMVTSDELTLGLSEGERGSVTIAGDSVWSNSAVIGVAGKLHTIQTAVSVGVFGDGNILSITNGGRMVSGSGLIGQESGSDSNSVLVSGAGSVWANTSQYSQMIIGARGSDNKLTISDGGRVEGGFCIIGDYPQYDYSDIPIPGEGENNSVLVTGEGSVWSTRGLGVGRVTSGNSMTIEDGGRVESVNGWIGGLSNSVTVSGSDSIWEIEVGLDVGAGPGSGSSLLIEDGGRVVSAEGHIGFAASGNSVTVSGIGSTWDVSGFGSTWYNAGRLSVGSAEFASDNSLLIENGGRVESADGYVGYDIYSSGNSATVSGLGSVWDNSGSLSVGHYGSGNSLLIEDGGQVVSRGASIGFEETASRNRVVVSGANSRWIQGLSGIYQAFPNQDMTIWSNGNTLIIGEAGTDNKVVIQDGGTITVGDFVITAGTNSSENIVVVPGGSFISTPGLNIGSGALTVPAGTFTSSSGTLTVQDGSVIGSVGGVIGSSVSNSVAISGGSSIWQSSSNLSIVGGNFSSNIVVIPSPLIATQILYELSYGDISVGRGGSYNMLEVEDGGLVTSYHGIIGELSNAWYNAVSVTGTNSEWQMRRDLYLGGRMSPMSYLVGDDWYTPWLEGGRGNSLNVGDGGVVSVGRDMHNRNYSTVTLDPGGSISVASNYCQDATSMLRFGVDTNSAGAPVNALMSVGGTAELEEGTRIDYAYNVGQLQFDRFYTNTLIEADQLIVAGVENADSLDLIQLDASGSLVDVIFWEDDQDIRALVGRKWLADSAGYSSNLMMHAFCTQVDYLSLLGDGEASEMINLLNGLTGSQQATQLSQQYEFGPASYRHIDSMVEGVDVIRRRTQRRQTAQPSGPGGPYRADQGVQSWVKPYGAWAEYSPGGTRNYDHSVYGTVVGIDQPMDSALLGIAGGYGRSVINQENGDYSEAKTGYGVLYLNWGAEDWFSHVNMAYGLSSVEQRSGSMFGNEGDFDASNFAASWSGGKEMRFKDGRYLLTPSMGLSWLYYSQDSYEEASNGGMSRTIAAYERESFLSTLGAAFAIRQEYDTMVLKPEIRLNWLHDFNADSDQVDYQLSDGSWFYYTMAAPEEDIIETGIGISALFNDELELVFDIDGRFGQDYSAYALSGRAVLEF